MAIYQAPTENLPIYDSSIFNVNQEINEAYLKAHYLKYPIAQGDETLKNAYVTGTLDITGLTTMKNKINQNSTTPANRTWSGSYLRFYDASLPTATTGGEKFVIYNTGSNMVFQSILGTSTNMSFTVRDGAGADVLALQLLSSGVIFNKPIFMSFGQGINMNNGALIQNGTPANVIGGITMIAGTRITQSSTGSNTFGDITMLATSRITQSSTGSNTLGDITMLDSSRITQAGTGSNTLGDITMLSSSRITQSGSGSNTLGGITQTSGSAIIQTGTVTNLFGNINQITGNGITQLGSPTNSLGTISMLANSSILQPAGTGVIQQVVTNATDMNTLKRSTVAIDTGSGVSGSGAVAMEIYDVASGSDGRGLYIIPNAGSGSLNSMVQTNDCGFMGRSVSRVSALTISIYSTDKIGIRLDAKTAGAPTITFSTLTNSIVLTKDWTSYTNPIKLLGTVLPGTSDLTVQGGMTLVSIGAGTLSSSASIQSYTNFGISQAGVYNITANVTIRSTIAASMTSFSAGLNTVNNAYAAEGTQWALTNYVNGGSVFYNIGTGFNANLSTTVNLTGSTTIYLNITAVFGGGSTIAIGGTFQAVRIA